MSVCKDASSRHCFLPRPTGGVRARTDCSAQTLGKGEEGHVRSQVPRARSSPLTYFAGPDTSNRWTAPVLPKASILPSGEKATLRAQPCGQTISSGADFGFVRSKR